MRLLWIIHNNTASSGRVIVEGLKKIPGIENLSSRLDLIWMYPPSDDLKSRWAGKHLGRFPDSESFVPELATPNFWNILADRNAYDWIVFTINAGNNHNAQQALSIIDSNNLYDKVVVLDEDESCYKWHSFRDLYMKSRIVLTALGDKVYYDLKKIRSNVFFIGFNGIEDRYLPTAIAEKDIDVYFKSRVEGWQTLRIPFRDRLLQIKGQLGNSVIMPPFVESEGNWFLKHISGDRHHEQYYDYLNRSRIVVYLNGFNPIGYQFWECAANSCCLLHQTPWRSDFFNGGNVNPQQFHWEHYNPPLIPGDDFLYFETPDDLESTLKKLLKHPEIVAKVSHNLKKKSTEFSSLRQAEKFLNFLTGPV